MSVEFMLLIVVFLFYIQVIVQPTLNDAEMGIADTKAVVQTKFAAQKLANAIEYIGASNGLARETVTIIAPEGSTILCGNDSQQDYLQYSVVVGGDYSECVAGACTENINLSKSIDVRDAECSNFSVNAADRAVSREVEVKKESDGSVTIS